MTFPSDAVITGVIGDTDSGKSAFMRSARYAFLLEKVYPRFGESKVAVEAAFDDIKLTRESIVKVDGTKSSDVITIGKDKWTKFHRQLPEGVVERTGIGFLNIPDLKQKVCLNFIGQTDQAMADAFKPSELSKIFGSISGRNVVDSAIKKTNANVLNLKREISNLETQLSDKNEEIDHNEARIPKHSPDTSDLLDTYDAYQLVVDLCNQFKEGSTKLHKLRKMVKKASNIYKSVDLGEIQEEYDRINGILKLVKEYRSIRIPNLKPAEAALNKIEMVQAAYECLKIVISTYGEYTDASAQRATCQKQILSTMSKLRDTNEQIRKVLLELGKCPYSGVRIPKQCVMGLAKD